MNKAKKAGDRISQGGAAFPVCVPDVNAEYTYEDGMSLRDYFAAKAMQGLLAMPGSIGGEQELVYSAFAQAAYKYADAMIAERSKK